jgi:hypothetical protein
MQQICDRNGWILGYDKGELVIGVTLQSGEQRSIVVGEFQDMSGQIALRLWTPIAPASAIPAEQALQLNMQLPHGALAIKDGRAVLVATRVYKDANLSDMSNLMSTIAYFGDFYGKHYGGGA